LKIVESTGRSGVNEPKYAEQNRTESKNAQSLQEAKKEAQGHMRILLAEDDDFLAGGIALALRNSRYSVDHVRLGTDADHALKYTDYDLLILDLGLPGMDGMEILVNLRSRGQSLPVLVLTARDSLQDRVEGLDSGANDYLTKPFELAELMARVRALIRKERWGNTIEFIYGPVKFNTASRRVLLNEVPVDLSARELAVLELLLQRAGRVVNKNQIADHLTSWDTDLTNNAIEIIVHRLRKKLECDGFTIRTMRGLGYLVEKTD
jgi:two-component system, OmpR family, response regulator